MKIATLALGALLLLAFGGEQRVPLFKIRRTAVLTCTTTTADASRTAVNNAISAASTGDVICVPAGSATWTSPINITKGITLSGAGIGNTVITANITVTFDACESSLICYDPATPANNSPFRVTGFTFDGNWSGGGIALNNTPYASSAIQTKIRIDHNRFQNCGNVGKTQRAVMSDGLSFGVIDQNVFVNNQKTFDEELSDDSGWAVSPDPGGPNSMYFEDNTVTNNDSRVSIITSGGQGGRYVARFNSINTTSANADNQHYDVHGNLSDRGTVIAEIYNNTLTTKTGAYQFLDHRGGIARVFNNKVIKPASDITIQLREEDAVLVKDEIILSYYWSNTYGTTTGLENAIVPFLCTDPGTCDGFSHIVENTDFWLQQTSFNGTVGMGVGVRASRPATCTVGVGYWSTDQGNWRTDNGATADGTLDRCTSTNTWTNAYYTPYTYPHPLRGGS